MAGKIVADTIEGTTTTETVDGSSVTIPNSVDTKYVVNGSAKAWLDKPTDGASITDSFAVSSLGDDDTGDFTVNVTTSFATAFFAPMGSCQNASSSALFNYVVETRTTSSWYGSTFYVTSTVNVTPLDRITHTAAFGDLA